MFKSSLTQMGSMGFSQKLSFEDNHKRYSGFLYHPISIVALLIILQMHKKEKWKYRKKPNKEKEKRKKEMKEETTLSLFPTLQILLDTHFYVIQ